VHLKITRVTRGNKVYQYAQLVESYRRPDGVSTQRVLANLGQRDDLEITNLRNALAASRDGKSVVVTAPELDTRHIEVLDNLAWLDVAVVIGSCASWAYATSSTRNCRARARWPT
jgi:hypothetical protein